MPLKYLRRQINDITTDFPAPPQFKVAPGSKPYRSEFAQVQKELHPEVRPLKSKMPADSVFAAIKELAHRRPGWRITYLDDTLHHLEATSVTRFLRFKDDVVIEVRSLDVGSLVHMRSRSRMGSSDFGKNAERIREFLDDLKGILDSLS